MNRYRTTLRPPAFGGLPQGVTWKYVEAPPDGRKYSDNLPVSKYLYGVIETDRPLTAKELDHYDIKRVPISGEELREKMRRLELNQDDLATITGNHIQAISRYCRGTLDVPFYVEAILGLLEEKHYGWRQAAE